VTESAILCTCNRATLGEGARWHARTRELLWVDITAGRLFREHVADDAGPLTRVATHDIGGCPSEQWLRLWVPNGWMLAAGGGFAYLGRTGT
jgi:SMP-30/Gluconolactonase/LRE-like region